MLSTFVTVSFEQHSRTVECIVTSFSPTDGTMKKSLYYRKFSSPCSTKLHLVDYLANWLVESLRRAFINMIIIQYVYDASRRSSSSLSSSSSCSSTERLHGETASLTHYAIETNEMTGDVCDWRSMNIVNRGESRTVSIRLSNGHIEKVQVRWVDDRRGVAESNVSRGSTNSTALSEHINEKRCASEQAKEYHLHLPPPRTVLIPELS
uniref:uncharacterized protein LOC117602984 n=1 Tax=Osmia lignaria TaxID=473952 RepID=UPI001478607D|nr:uncharacterized protein LOC117602984 [Osmia lignaria]